MRTRINMSSPFSTRDIFSIYYGEKLYIIFMEVLSWVLRMKAL